MIVAELRAGNGEHRDARTELGFERATAIDIDDFDRKRGTGLETAQTSDHVVA